MSENMDEDVLIQLSVSDHLQRQIFDAFQSIPQLVQGRLYSFFSLCAWFEHHPTAYVSLRRIEEFLNNVRQKDSRVCARSNVHQTDVIDGTQQCSPPPRDNSTATTIGLGPGVFAWTSSATNDNTASSRRAFRLDLDEEIKFTPGALNLIIGPTASGASSDLLCHSIPAYRDLL
jgi:hypothetical protein